GGRHAGRARRLDRVEHARDDLAGPADARDLVVAPEHDPHAAIIVPRPRARHLPQKTGCFRPMAELHRAPPPRIVEEAMVIRLSDEKTPTKPRREGERQTGLVLDERTRTKKPPMYKVLLHNDDYTTKEFVVWVLQTVFHRSEGDAVAIMSHV